MKYRPGNSRCHIQFSPQSEPLICAIRHESGGMSLSMDNGQLEEFACATKYYVGHSATEST